MEQEIWKPIKGYEGRYEISNLGRVKLLSKRVYNNRGGFRIDEEKIVLGHPNHRGYMIMRLTSNGERKTWKVHRLVAAAFIPNEDNKVEVNHKDGNKSNNCVDNLEWNTPSENSIHAFRIGLRKNASEEKHGMAKLTKEQVLEIRKLREEGKPRKEVASIYGVHHCYITFLTSKKYWANI